MVLYHGSKQERQAIRSKRMPVGERAGAGRRVDLFGQRAVRHTAARHGTGPGLFGQTRWQLSAAAGLPTHPPAQERCAVLARARPACPAMRAAAAQPASPLTRCCRRRRRPLCALRCARCAGKMSEAFPVVVTSYEIVIADVKFLQKVGALPQPCWLDTSFLYVNP